MASFPKTIYVKRERADGDGGYFVATPHLEDLVDKGGKITIAIYEVKEYLVAGLTL